MDEGKLAACPFCGGEASMFKAKGEGPPYIPCCTKCSASLSLEWIEEEAERAWNTRTLSPPDGAEERVARALETLLSFDLMSRNPAGEPFRQGFPAAVTEARAAIAAMGRGE